MDERRYNPSEDEVKTAYRMVKGMASRKAFVTEQDREDFVQNVILSALSSYNPTLDSALSFKNLACGLAFKRAYQSYWSKWYGRRGGAWRAGLPAARDTVGEAEFGAETQVHDTETFGAHDGIRKAPREEMHDGYEVEQGDWKASSPAREWDADCVGDDDIPDPTDVILKNMVREEIEGLGSPYSELIQCFLLGMTREETARHLNRSASWAKKYTLSAMEKLLKRLGNRGIEVVTTPSRDMTI